MQLSHRRRPKRISEYLDSGITWAAEAIVEDINLTTESIRTQGVVKTLVEAVEDAVGIVGDGLAFAGDMLGVENRLSGPRASDFNYGNTLSQFGVGLPSLQFTGLNDFDSIFIRHIQKNPGDGSCLECGQKSDWVSTTFGIFLCLECGGKQRSLGTHITRVRSMSMDSWTPEQAAVFEFGGNARFSSFMKANNLLDKADTFVKYLTTAGEYYGMALSAVAENSKLPPCPENVVVPEGVLTRSPVSGFIEPDLLDI